MIATRLGDISSPGPIHEQVSELSRMLTSLRRRLLTPNPCPCPLAPPCNLYPVPCNL